MAIHAPPAPAEALEEALEAVAFQRKLRTWPVRRRKAGEPTDTWLGLGLG